MLTSPSFHHVELARPAHDDLLVEVMDIALQTDLPDDYGPPPPRRPGNPGLVPASRREALLAQAVRMFGTYGYGNVGIEDIGAAVDIAGPSVHNHYASKLDMLTTAFQRGSAALYTDVTAAYAAATDPTDALTRLIDSYLGFGLAHHNLMDLLITETGHLSTNEQQRARQAQREYLDEWTHLLKQVHPGFDSPTARIRVHATIDVINNAVRIPHLRRNPRLPSALRAICTHMLRLHERSP